LNVAFLGDIDNVEISERGNIQKCEADAFKCIVCGRWPLKTGWLVSTLSVAEMHTFLLATQLPIQSLVFSFSAASEPRAPATGSLLLVHYLSHSKLVPSVVMADSCLFKIHSWQMQRRCLAGAAPLPRRPGSL
jgi:hypothetical protein